MKTRESSPEATASFERSLDRIEHFARALEQLPPGSWRSLQARCQTLAGDAPGQIAARARLRAASIKPDDYLRNADHLLLRGMGSALRLFVDGTSLACEIAIAAQKEEPFYLSRRTTSSGKPFVDRYIDLRYDLEQAMVTAIGKDHMTLHVLHAVMFALQNAERLWRPDFLTVYAWVAPEVPLSRVDPTLAM